MSKKDLESIRKRIKEFRRTAVPFVDVLSKQAEAIAVACERVSRSWSGSFAGYHGRLYYENFESPTLGNMFSPEWGGLNGIPEGWDQRSPEEVKAAIEHRAGSSFSIDKAETLTEDLIAKAEQFQNELLDYLSDVSFGSDRAKRLLAELETLKFHADKKVYVLANLPKQLVTRDSSAALQGICTPSHVYYEGVAYEIAETSNAVRKFLKLLDRLEPFLDHGEDAAAPMQESQLSTLHPELLTKCSKLYEDGHYAEAVEKGFKVVKDRLRRLTGEEKGADAFGKGKLYIRGAAAANVEEDFNKAVMFLTMAIDRFRNEKSHTADSKIDNPVRAYEYLRLSSLALHLLDEAEVRN